MKYASRSRWIGPKWRRELVQQLQHDLACGGMILDEVNQENFNSVVGAFFASLLNEEGDVEGAIIDDGGATFWKTRLRSIVELKLDFIKRMKKQGCTTTKIAEELGMGPRTYLRWVQKHQPKRKSDAITSTTKRSHPQ